MGKELADEIALIYSLIDAGKYKDALDELTRIELDCAEDTLFNINRIGLLAEIGQGLRDPALMKRSLTAISLLDKPEYEKYRSHIHFELANANMAQYHINRRIPMDVLKDSNMQEAKYHLRKAIMTCDETDSETLVQLWVNYGNCLDTLGRGVEAISAYDHALKIRPNHPMAVGNKAVALLSFANISGEYVSEICVKSFEMLKAAIKDDAVLPLAKNSFQKDAQYVEKILQSYDDELPKEFKHTPHDSNQDSPLEKCYFGFCSRNGLFLNLHIQDDKCESSMRDSIGLSLILPIEDKTTYPNLANFLNQIKEDYAVARFLLVQSQFKDNRINRISSRTSYTDTLEYCEFNLQIGLLEAAFKEAYGILDKIAGFINTYLSIGLDEDKVTFDAGSKSHERSIWQNKNGTIRKAISETDNGSLFALYDVFRDFDSGHYDSLKKIRNALTHRRLVVHIFCNDIEGHIHIEDLKKKAIELMQLVRSAIIYLTNFIRIEENKKRTTSDGPIMPLHFPSLCSLN